MITIEGFEAILILEFWNGSFQGKAELILYK